MNSPTSKLLKDAFDEIEARSEPLSEHQVSDAIRRLRDKDDPSPQPMEWLAEVMAFDFCEDYQNKETGWGTYFGPMMAGTNEDGSHWESPSLKLVTPEVLDYWTERAREAKHPILKARYAALVWDFTNPVTGQAAPVEIAWIRIDSVIAAATSDAHKYETEIIKKLRHALQLAVSLNDAARVERVRDAILAYGDKVAKDDKPGLWCFVYDLLLNQKKVPLTEAQKTKIIGDFEGRLERVSDTSDNRSLDPWAAEAAAVRLAKHYRVHGQLAEVKRVLLKYGSAFEKMAEPAVAMLAQAWFQKVHQVYRDFGLKDDAERLLRRIRELGPKALDDLKPISAEMKITNEEMAGFVQIEDWARTFKTSVTSTARRSIELSDFPCALAGVREGRVGFSFHSRALIEGECYPKPRGTDLPAEVRPKWQAFLKGTALDGQGQAFARDWCQTYDNDRAAQAPVYEYYYGVPSMQTLLVLLTIPEEELFPDTEDG